MTLANFKRNTTPASTSAAPAKPLKQAKARYGGITATAPKPDFPTYGSYCFEILNFEEGELIEGKDTQSVRLTVKVIESEGDEAQPAGTECFVAFRVQGGGATAGKGRMKAFIVAASGFADEEAYNAYDPDGFGIDALLGYAAPAPYAGTSLVGRRVFCEVAKGNEMRDRETKKPTGQFFSEYTWAPAEDPIG